MALTFILTLLKLLVRIKVSNETGRLKAHPHAKPGLKVVVSYSDIGNGPLDGVKHKKITV